MYNIKLYDYVPKPEPASSDKIVAAHYYPSWTKGQNGLNHEFDDLANYPERTPLMGYYEDKNPEVMDWEIKWALEHGINCFIYCWYRRKENVGKPVTREGLRLSQGLHDGFFNARYCNMMHFAIMFETLPRWGAADKEDLLNNVLPFWIENYFSRENYLKIDNKPVVFSYDGGRQLVNALGGDEGMSETLDACREVLKAHGFDGMLFCSQAYWSDTDRVKDAKKRGIDAVFEYHFDRIDAKDPDGDSLYKSQMDFNLHYMGKDSTAYIPSVCNFFDPEPRFTTMPFIEWTRNFWYADFKTYRRLLRSVKALSDAAPQDSLAHKMIMVDNFNEWDEGHFLLPSYKFGFKYLQCIREELTERDNTPDYRMPAQLGFGPYDTAWGGEAIDLSANNDRKLDDGEFTLYRE